MFVVCVRRFGRNGAGSLYSMLLSSRKLRVIEKVHSCRTGYQSTSRSALVLEWTHVRIIHTHEGEPHRDAMSRCIFHAVEPHRILHVVELGQVARHRKSSLLQNVILKHVALRTS